MRAYAIRTRWCFLPKYFFSVLWNIRFLFFPWNDFRKYCNIGILFLPIFPHRKKTSMLKLKALWSRSYWFTCALYHSTRYWISSLAALLHDIKFIHFNSAASLHIYQYLLFICDLYYLKNIWVPLTFLRYFRVNMHSSVTVSPFFAIYY